MKNGGKSHAHRQGRTRVSWFLQFLNRHGISIPRCFISVVGLCEYLYVYILSSLNLEFSWSFLHKFFIIDIILINCDNALWKKYALGKTFSKYLRPNQYTLTKSMDIKNLKCINLRINSTLMRRIFKVL